MITPADFGTAKKSLAVVWFIGASLPFGIFLIQSLGGKWDDQVIEAWQWLLPNVLPTLALMMSVLVADSGKARAERPISDHLLYRITLILSFTYFLVLWAGILTMPLRGTTPEEFLAHLQQSNLWLGPMQGLLAGGLGAFFVKPGDGDPAPAPA